MTGAPLSMTVEVYLIDMKGMTVISDGRDAVCAKSLW
jgi:hypothetical protein